MKKSKLIFTAGLGSLFESFDFYLFSLFAVALNYSFFGRVDKHSVLWIFLIFAIGYLARIFGALVFGYWGDKIGRLYSFKKTIVVMALSSIVIGFIPTYESIGILAVIFLIIMRFIQGISIGGEESGATIVIMERYKKHQSLLILFVSLMVTAGVFIAKLIYFILGSFLSYQEMLDYGWRIAYIIGGILIFHSYQTRKKIAESDEFKFNKDHRVYKNTIYEMILNYKKLLCLGVFSLAGIQLFWGVFLIYLPNYMLLEYPHSHISSNVYYILIVGDLIGKTLGAIFADKLKIRTVFSIGISIAILLILPLYFSMNVGINNSFYILLFLIACAIGSTGVLGLLLLSKRFPTRYRYTLVSTTYAFSAFFFVGIPPFLLSYFTREASMFYPIVIFAIGCIVQLIAVQIFYKKTEIFQKIV